jgi:hypothetical protein
MDEVGWVCVHPTRWFRDTYRDNTDEKIHEEYVMEWVGGVPCHEQGYWDYYVGHPVPRELQKHKRPNRADIVFVCPKQSIRCLQVSDFNC